VWPVPREEGTRLAKDDAEFDVAELNDVVHQRTRLGLLVVLRELQQADFTYLKTRLKLTDGNLGQHIEILKQHGLISIRKGHEGQRARTWVKITRAGEKALASEIKTLRSLLDL
jgi:DNA-binding MarR family transcriptional regulator